MKYQFESKAKWQGGLKGGGDFRTRGLEVKFSVPTELSGTGEGTNPEELLLGASASCFLLTLGIVLSYQKVQIREISVESSLEMETENGFSVTSILHSPTVLLEDDITPERIRAIENAVLRAEGQCLVAKAMRGNVQVRVLGPAIERAR